MDGHGTDQGRTLTHPAGQLGRFFIFKGRKTIVRKKFQDIIAVGLSQCVLKLQAKDHILIDGAPFKKVVTLQHITDRDRIIVTAVRQASAPIEQRSLFWRKQPGYDGQQGGFTDSAVMEISGAQLAIKIKVFTGKVYKETFDMVRFAVCDPILYLFS